jgi:AsmA protein
MRRLILIAGVAIGVAILIVVAVVGYAYLNLNSIIASNRARLLDRASAAVGRPIQADELKASLGRGVAIEVTGVKLADDAAFSQLPFVQADDVFLKVELIPLLRKEIKVTELVLRQPQIRIIRGASGAMNVSTIAKKGPTGAGNPTEPGATPEFGIAASSNKSGGASTISNVTIETFTIEDGRIFYLDQQAGGAPVTINAVNLKVANFSVAEPFDVALDLAAFGDRKNLELLGTAGPIAKDGAIEAGAIPINLVATVGPLTLAELKSVPQLAKAIPRALMLSDEVKLQAKVTGTLDAISFDASSDLSANRVAFAPSFDKPAGTTFKFTASGARTAGKVVVQQADLGLADLQAKLTHIVFATGRVSARVDTNKFDLGPIAELISAAQPYNPTGAAEIHTAISLVNSKPALNGTITLVNVNAAMPDAKTPPVSDLNGTIRLAGNTANLGPLTFKLGSGNAQLQASADSIRPAHATYRLSVDKITVAELVPSRKDAGDENLMQVSASGTVGERGGAFGGSTKLSAASGLLANVPFTLLALDANYGGDRVNVNSLKFGAFDGSIGAAGVAKIGTASAFDFKIDTQHVNMQKALDSQHSPAANTIRGNLTGNIQIAGRGKGLDQIKPTMRGAGRARMDKGKLVGVNVVAQALKKVDNVPGIGALVPAAVVANHPELFQSPDTDIQQASLTFEILGPRIISHDIVARSTDYSIFGDGWFDLDKNLDLAAKIKMSRPFSSELVAAKHNISYVTNSDGEVEIPLRVSGQLPHPSVVPDVGVIAQRAATHAVQNRVGELIQKKGLGDVLKKNGLGGLLGGLTGGGADSNGGANDASPSSAGGSNDRGSLPNPFKGLFH